MTLRRAPLIAVFLINSLIPYAATAQELDVLKDTTHRWIQTRNRISKDKSDWIAEKELLQGSIDTLTSTEEIFTDNVEILQMQSSDLAKKIEEANSQVASFVQTNEFIKSHVTVYEKRIQDLAKRLPTPLVDEIRPLLRKIPSEENDSTPTPNRLQNVIAISTLIDEFNNDLTLAHTIKTLEDGSAIEVRVLYWGLAGAYASNTDGTNAWIITPAQGEWTWNDALDNAPAIKRLFDVYDKSVDPALVQIPFSFHSEGGVE
ncbi:hypothetical protein VDG1235_984 [Verrucomicrobiia bacterium DG1235]|nr:hypothetical protein VDG1235_984 [Verrucomicrobiae bacterium DG1235]